MKLIKVKKADAGDRFFVVVEQGGKKLIESGWGKVEEAKDMVKELPKYLSASVVGVAKLGGMGLDPANKSHWLK